MIEFKKIDKNQYNAVVEVHMDAFEGFFLTSLGKSFLKTYYKSLLKSEECLAVCALDDHKRMIGFAIGTTLSMHFHKKIVLRNFFNFFWEGLKIIFLKPKALFRLLRNMTKTGNSVDKGDYAELLSIGVLKKCKSLGVGKGLLDEFEKMAKDRACKQIALTTDYYENKSVFEFYKKKGFVILYVFMSYPRRKMYKLIKILK